MDARAHRNLTLEVENHCVGQGSVIRTGGTMKEYFQIFFKFYELSSSILVHATTILLFFVTKIWYIFLALLCTYQTWKKIYTNLRVETNDRGNLVNIHSVLSSTLWAGNNKDICRVFLAWIFDELETWNNKHSCFQQATWEPGGGFPFIVFVNGEELAVKTSHFEPYGKYIMTYSRVQGHSCVAVIELILPSHKIYEKYRQFKFDEILKSVNNYYERGKEISMITKKLVRIFAEGGTKDFQALKKRSRRTFVTLSIFFGSRDYTTLSTAEHHAETIDSYHFKPRLLMPSDGYDSNIKLGLVSRGYKNYALLRNYKMEVFWQGLPSSVNYKITISFTGRESVM
ncbi:hypothetical protein C5167_009223, partial [Papaver somniferum]